ncbi:MAG TPA: UbiA family prenyltransferase [Bacteroidia bacterium]|mgnify:FL=1|nr:UbiA family prenyltransferase [Bacteroidia bacterium]HMU20429.1 UbiA family prenyltransferase [Bacteroidia bacterium]
MFRKIAHKTVSYNLLIALAASAASHLTILRINEQNNLVLIAIIFFATLSIYNFPRLPLQKPLTTRTWICFSSILVAALLIFNYNFISINLFLTAILFCLIYMMPFNYKGKRIKGIRNIFLLKNIFLAASWALITVLLPMAALGHESPIISEVFLLRFIYVFGISLLFDIRDTERDKTRNHLTLPVVLGTTVTRYIVIASAAIFILIVTVLYRHQHFTESMAFAFMISALLLVVAAITAPPASNFRFYQIGVDSLLIVQWLLVVVAVKFF